jgi:hypothetical protein
MIDCLQIIHTHSGLDSKLVLFIQKDATTNSL